MCCGVEAPREGRLYGRLAEENVEETGAMRRVELEPVMADTGVNVEINGGKVNVPGDEAIPATETCGLATDEETAEDGDCEGPTVFSATDEAEEFDACELWAFT